MIEITVTRGQTFANIAQHYYGSVDYVAKLLNDNNLGLSSDINEGDKLLIDETFKGNLSVKKELQSFPFDVSNGCLSSDFRKIINRNSSNPGIIFDGMGVFSIDGNTQVIHTYNNTGRFSPSADFSEIDLRNFHLSFFQIQFANSDLISFDAGEYPELEIFKVINSPTLDILISQNLGRRLKIVLNNCKYVDFSNINNVYDVIDISVANSIIARKNDDFCEILAAKKIVCGGEKKLFLAGLTTPRGKLALDKLYSQGWSITATGW